MDKAEELMLPEAVTKALEAQARKYFEADNRFKATLFAYFSVDDAVIPAMGVANRAFVNNQLAHPFALHVGRIQGGRFQRVDSIVHGRMPGIADMGFWVRELPAATYVVISAPCIELDAVPARKAIAAVVGLLVAIVGRAATLTSIGEHLIEVEGNRLSVQTTVPRMSELEDTASFNDQAILGEVLQAIKGARGEVADSVMFGIQVLGRATQEADDTFRFTLHWVALEVIAQTNGDGIATKLGSAYGKSKKFAYDDLLFRRVYDERHLVTHKGGSVVLKPRMERLMQCYFLDLLRVRLKLPCRRLTLGLLEDLAKVDKARP